MTIAETMKQSETKASALNHHTAERLREAAKLL
jgi:hypothetical protein